MKSQKLGNDTSKIEVLSISKEGIWLYLEPYSKEYFLSYDDFPWFRKAKVSEVFNVRFEHGHRLRWEDLDVDLEVESLERLEQYPLKYKE